MTVANKVNRKPKSKENLEKNSKTDEPFFEFFLYKKNTYKNTKIIKETKIMGGKYVFKKLKTISFCCVIDLFVISIVYQKNKSKLN